MITELVGLAALTTEAMTDKSSLPSGYERYVDKPLPPIPCQQNQTSNYDLMNIIWELERVNTRLQNENKLLRRQSVDSLKHVKALLRSCLQGVKALEAPVRHRLSGPLESKDGRYSCHPLESKSSKGYQYRYIRFLSCIFLLVG